MLVVHLHFHPRRTGVTRHVEAVVPPLGRELEVRVMGQTLDPALPRIGWSELLERSRREPVVVHAHRNNEVLSAVWLRALRPRVKVVMTRHSGTPPSAYTRWLSKRADVRVTLTRAMAALFDPTSRVIPHGVALPPRIDPGARREALGALGVAGGRAVGVVGRIRPAKGTGDFAQAVAPLLASEAQSPSGWRGLLVGRIQPEDARWAGQVLAQAPGLLHLPERPEIDRVYAALTVCVQPSHSEGYSLVLLEAMAAGCCVLASALPYAREVIDDGSNGLLFPVGDIAALREQLRALIADPARAEALGAAAAETARRRLGIDHEASALAALYRELSASAS